jgi:hypothetical protein
VKLIINRLPVTGCFILLVYACISCDPVARPIPLKPVQPDSSVLAADNDLFAATPLFTRQLQLPSIEHGVDSFEYRIWCPESADVINLIRIRHEQQGWIITETHIWSHIPEHRYRRGDTVNYLLQTIVDSSHTTVLTPRIAVQAFIDSLQYFNLQEAPSNAAIASSTGMVTDSWRYTFELADKVHYRIIEYNVGDVRGLKAFHQSIWALLYFLKRALNVSFRNPLEEYSN